MNGTESAFHCDARESDSANRLSAKEDAIRDELIEENFKRITAGARHS